MKVNFNKQQILTFALKTIEHGKLFVTSKGTMFRNVEAAESAVRTLNAIIDEPSEYVGIVELTKEKTFTKENLALYGKKPELFNALFKEARVPRQRTSQVSETRKVEEYKADDAKVLAELQDIFGLSEKNATEEKPAEGAPAKVENNNEKK